MPAAFVKRFVESGLEDIGVGELWKLQVTRNSIQKRMLDWWQQTARKTQSARPIDGILSPVNPFPAPLLKYGKSIAYTSFINLLDYPAMTFPVTFADRDIDIKEESYKPISVLDAEARDIYDPDVFHGAPVGLQVIGPRLHDEKVYALARVIDQILQNRPQH